ncbi:MAG: PPC domain-containing protein [Hyphomonadaceae bacterium]
MRGKLLIGAATAALMMFAPAALAQDGDQPGDATTSATVSVGQTVDGAVDAEADVDWYRLRVEPGQRYTITLDAASAEDGTGLDPMLAVYDAQGNQLAFNDDYNGLNSLLAYTPSSAGEVFVEARGFADASTGAYRLGVTAAEIPPDDIGNDASTRGRINVGRPVTGNIEYEGDFDWYRFNGRSDQRYTISLARAGDDGLGDPILRVLDRDGNELAGNDDSGEASLDSQLQFIPPSSGTFYLEARGYADAYTGAYTLTVEAEDLPEDGISADRSTRGRIATGQDVGGTLDFPTDRDWYRIRLEEGQSYRFLLSSAGDTPVGDPLLRLYDASGAELAMDDDGGEGLNAYLEFTAPSSGNYFVEARGFLDDATGGYQLSARAGDLPGDMSTDASLSAEGDYREGVLGFAGDRDWYRVTLAEGQGMRIGLSSDGSDGSLGDPYLILYGPDGAEVGRDDDSGDGLNAWLEYQAPAAGDYYVEARGFSEDAQGRYVIALTAGEIGASPDQAEYLQPNGEGRISIIGAGDDVDWFAIEMIEGRPYRFSLEGYEPGPLSDPMLTLYDPQGNQVAIDDDGGTGLNAYLTHASPTGGPYFAAVSSYDGATGRYWLRVTDTDVPGNIYTDENVDSADDDRLSRIDMPGDLDYYRVMLEGGVTYTIDVKGQAGEDPLADPFVAIMDSQNERVASDDDSGDGYDARLRFTPEESGEYYIQASGLGGSTGWYQVRIVRQ